MPKLDPFQILGTQLPQADMEVIVGAFSSQTIQYKDFLNSILPEAIVFVATKSKIFLINWPSRKQPICSTLHIQRF